MSENQRRAEAAVRRLQNELISLLSSPPMGISAFPNGDNLFSWTATIQGVPSTPYGGLSFKLEIEFPRNYPLTPPEITFKTNCFHPNVGTDGKVCLDILKERWTAGYTVTSILLSLQSLLGEPNNDSPLNQQAAFLWHNKDKYRRHVIEACKGTIDRNV